MSPIDFDDPWTFFFSATMRLTSVVLSEMSADGIEWVAITFGTQNYIPLKKS